MSIIEKLIKGTGDKSVKWERRTFVDYFGEYEGHEIHLKDQDKCIYIIKDGTVIKRITDAEELYDYLERSNKSILKRMFGRKK